MRVADVVSRYLDSAQAIYEIITDQASLEKALVLPARLGELQQLRLDKLATGDFDPSPVFLAVVQVSEVEMLVRVMDTLRPCVETASSSGTWVFLLSSDALLVPHLLPGLSERDFAILTVEPVNNRGWSTAVVARPVPEMQDAAPWTRVLAAAVGEKAARSIAAGTTEEGILRSQLRLRNEYICQDTIARMSESKLRNELKAAKDCASQLTTEVSQLVQEMKTTEFSEAHQQKQLAPLQAEIARLEHEAEASAAYQHQRQEQLEVLEARLETAKSRYQAVVDSNRYKLARVIGGLGKNTVSMVKLPRQGLSLAKSVLARGLSARKSPPAQVAPRQREARSPVTILPHSRPDVVNHGTPATPKRTKDLWVAGIFDEMTMACFEPECNLISFTPNNWRERLQERPPHLLFVESAWQGNGGSWQYKIGQYNHPDVEGLQDLLDWCHRHRIPTVFWNKEDPVHFLKFRDAARRFDHVFTTDQNVIERYRELDNSIIKSVGVLPFAAQPQLHNPVFTGERNDSPCFAGSYYGNRHASRRLQQEALLDGARPFGLVLYDRNFGANNADFEFPERFATHIKGRLPYTELSRVYRQHKIFLNVNSVIDSPTMLSRRVFELLACGTVVVSTPSKALESIFGDLVPTVSSEEEAREVISHLLDDDAARLDLARRGIRFVFSQHTYANRLFEVAKAVGLDVHTGVQSDVNALGLADSLEEAQALADVVSAHEHLLSEVFVGTTADLDVVESVMRRTLPKHPLRLVKQSADEGPARFTQLGRMAGSRYVFVPDTQNAIDSDTLTDLMQCIQFTSADVIGQIRSATTDALFEHQFVDALHTHNCLIRRTLVASVGWQIQRGTEPEFMARLRREGASLYCAHHAKADDATPQGGGRSS